MQELKLQEVKLQDFKLLLSCTVYHRRIAPIAHAAIPLLRAAQESRPAARWPHDSWQQKKFAAVLCHLACVL